MKIGFIIVSFFCCMLLHGQNISKIQKVKKLNLDNLNTVSDIYSFRLWDHGQIIEVRVLSDSTKTGQIINFVTEYFEPTVINSILQESKLVPNIYLQKFNLPDSSISKVIGLIKKYKIQDIPAGDSIKGWLPTLDGGWYTVAQKINDKYESKNYTDPDAQKNLPEAQSILNFFVEINKALGLRNKYDIFFGKLHFGCYKIYGYDAIVQCNRSKVKVK